MSPELLLEWVGIVEPPVEPQALAERLDVILAIDNLRPYVSVLAVSGKHAGILVDRTADADLRRLAVAHAIGHLVLHDGVEFREVSFAGETTDEVEADLYAARLLVPMPWLEAKLASCPSVDELAAAFGVSATSIRKRLRSGGLDGGPTFD
jgi:Zn-dependent peptidase ImmA (M78 family)